MYRIPVFSCRVRCAASFRRCASPPESVVPDCPSRRYPSPTSSSTRRREVTFGDGAKNASASRAVICSTSWMFLSLYRTSRTLLLYRVPRHSSHTSSTSARKRISTVTVPSPWQASQRPPGMLNEKCPAVNPRFFASGVDANTSRIGSNAFKTVATLSPIPTGPLSLQRFVQDVVNQGGFAGARNAGNRDEQPERNHH